jgi:hypothetical protein
MTSRGRRSTCGRRRRRGRFDFVEEAPEAETRVSNAAMVILILLTLINILVLVEAVPAFQKGYMDMLPGKPLPEATLFVLQYRLFIAFFDAAIVISAALCASFRDANAKWIAHSGLVWNALQIGIVGIALYMPTVPVIEPMLVKPIPIGGPSTPA